MTDRFLRNNLGDDDYAEFSAALDALLYRLKNATEEGRHDSLYLEAAAVIERQRAALAKKRAKKLAAPRAG